MPAKPSAAAARNASTGKMHASSQRAAWGANSRSAKSRAVSCMARCSSLSSKSMARSLLRRLAFCLGIALGLVLREHRLRRRLAHGGELLIVGGGPVERLDAMTIGLAEMRHDVTRVELVGFLRRLPIGPIV